jgi:hypothetical protein
MHAHCSFNCFREIRDAEVEEIIQLLTVCIFSSALSSNSIDIFFQGTSNKCPRRTTTKTAGKWTWMSS